MSGELTKHLNQALQYSSKAAVKYKSRAVDTGDEQKQLDVRQKITEGAYELPCRLFNDTVRFGIFWGWNQVPTSSNKNANFLVLLV